MNNLFPPWWTGFFFFWWLFAQHLHSLFLSRVQLKLSVKVWGACKDKLNFLAQVSSSVSEPPCYWKLSRWWYFKILSYRVCFFLWGKRLAEFITRKVEKTWGRGNSCWSWKISIVVERRKSMIKARRRCFPSVRTRDDWINLGKGEPVLNGVGEKFLPFGNLLFLCTFLLYLFFLNCPAFLFWKHPELKFSNWLFRKTLNLKVCYQNTTDSRNRLSCERKYSKSFQEFCHCSCRFYSS